MTNPNGCTVINCPLMRLPKDGCKAKGVPVDDGAYGDVVEVVRCKDCKYLAAFLCGHFICVQRGGVVTPESYCSFAARKEVQENE